MKNKSYAIVNSKQMIQIIKDTLSKITKEIFKESTSVSGHMSAVHYFAHVQDPEKYPIEPCDIHPVAQLMIIPILGLVMYGMLDMFHYGPIRQVEYYAMMAKK